jgi:carbonic anhydrase
MCNIDNLLSNNIDWATDIKNKNPDLFKTLAKQQKPEYLWIGCADSRVPANEIVGLASGELFVHRNIANLVQATDLNCLAVLQYAVDILKVKHVIVCGHYGCGGVEAAMDNEDHGLVDGWLRQIKDTYVKNSVDIDKLETQEARINKLCELNVVVQVDGLVKTRVVQNAWERGQELHIHGLIYSINDGIIKDMNITKSDLTTVNKIYHLCGKAKS